MNALYECTVTHCRLKPKRHAFRYRVFMFCADVDDLPALGRRVPFFSHNRFNLFSIDDRDHVTCGGPGNIRSGLGAWLAGQGVSLPEDAKIELVTFPRVLGYGFNPVSFYYISSAAGDPIVAVAEVVNTFREMKLYVVDSMTSSGSWRRKVAKDFYVSPFSDPGHEFDFHLGIPGDQWRVKINDCDAAGRVLLSEVRGEKRPLSAARLIWYAFKYPMLSLKIIGLIHWHAFLLWLRKVPHFRKSDRRESQLGVLRPHSSLQEKLP